VDDQGSDPAARRTRLTLGILGCVTLLAIGWTGLLIPSLIRSIEATFGQTDAGIGVVYLLYALAYTSGSFAGGTLTERLGRRFVLGGALLIHGAGIAGLGLAPTWELFMVATLVGGFGAGALDGGANGLVLDVYREGRGRAMNLLHTSFAVGALAAPLALGTLVEAGVPWQSVVVGTGVVIALLAIAYAVMQMPNGRRSRNAGATVDADGAHAGRSLLAGPLLLLGFAIAAYVASEVGVSNWVVRFLEPAPLTTATLALSLFWLGIMLGRLVSSAIADRFDHLTFTVVCALAMGVLIGVAVLTPALPLSILAFAAAGAAAGPIFPMIVAIGGERYPERSAAVGGSLVGMAVVGSTIYPPLMGFLSVTVGLTVAMLGNVVLALACAIALVVFGRVTNERVRETDSADPTTNAPIGGMDDPAPTRAA
jgi:fucose permease